MRNGKERILMRKGFEGGFSRTWSKRDILSGERRLSDRYLDAGDTEKEIAGNEC